MLFVKIPHIDDAWDNVQIEALSPSTFSWVSHGCGYQVLLQKALQTFRDETLSLPSNKNAILGTIIHKLYELSLKGELHTIMDLKSKWEELVSDAKEKLAANYPTLQNASMNNYDKRNSAIRYAMGIIKKTGNTQAQEGTAKVYSEKWLDCVEIGLKGIADKLIIDGGCVDVIDFKSGHVKDEDGNIKNEYIIQLHLYAAMCQYLSLGQPRTLKLIDIDGQEHEVPFSEEYVRQLQLEVKETLQVLKDTIASRKFECFAKPELGMCSNCSCRHVCKYRDVSQESYYQTITGEVIEIPSTNMYVLKNGEHKIYVSGIDVYNVDSPLEYIGKTLTFVNITRASQQADEYTYKVTENTLVYEQL